jgi:hypothetical protein
MGMKYSMDLLKEFLSGLMPLRDFQWAIAERLLDLREAGAYRTSEHRLLSHIDLVLHEGLETGATPNELYAEVLSIVETAGQGILKAPADPIRDLAEDPYMPFYRWDPPAHPEASSGANTQKDPPTSPEASSGANTQKDPTHYRVAA